LFDGENISFDASLVIYINSTNIPPIMIINRIYEHKILLSLLLVSFLVGLRTYQHPCIVLLYNIVLLAFFRSFSKNVRKATISFFFASFRPSVRPEGTSRTDRSIFMKLYIYICLFRKFLSQNSIFMKS